GALLEQLGVAGERQPLDAVDEVVHDRVDGHGAVGVEGVEDVHGHELVELHARLLLELEPELEGPAPVVGEDDAHAHAASAPRNALSSSSRSPNVRRRSLSRFLTISSCWGARASWW